MKYLSKYFPTTAEMCKPLRRLPSVKTEWTLSQTYDELYNKAKAIIKRDACMKFYKGKEPLYSEIEASGVGLGTGLLQVR